MAAVYTAASWIKLFNCERGLDELLKIEGGYCQ